MASRLQHTERFTKGSPQIGDVARGAIQKNRVEFPISVRQLFRDAGLYLHAPFFRNACHSLRRFNPKTDIDIVLGTQEMLEQSAAATDGQGLSR